MARSYRRSNTARRSPRGKRGASRASGRRREQRIGPVRAREISRRQEDHIRGTLEGGMRGGTNSKTFHRKMDTSPLNADELQLAQCVSILTEIVTVSFLNMENDYGVSDLIAELEDTVGPLRMRLPRASRSNKDGAVQTAPARPKPSEPEALGRRGRERDSEAGPARLKQLVNRAFAPAPEEAPYKAPDSTWVEELDYPQGVLEDVVKNED